MIDVFISYTTRGLTDDHWIKFFREDLIRYYKSLYSKELTVWLAPLENTVGDNFRTQIRRALSQSSILLLILEPEYLNSPETLKEVNDFAELKESSGDETHFIKVIVFKGKKGHELKSFISSDILSVDFFTANIDNNQVPFIRGSQEYINQIQNINKSIWVRQVASSRKNNSQKILDLLAQLPNTPKLYVGFSYSSQQDRLQRNRFIQQLKETINRDKNLQDVIILPDELTTAGLSYEDLEELFYEANEDGENCIRQLLDASMGIVLRIVSDNLSEAAELISNISQQHKLIHDEQLLKKKTVTIFADVPKEIYATSPFFEAWENPLYFTKSNFKLLKDKDISTFIDSYLDILRPALGTRVASHAETTTTTHKRIFIIEPFTEPPQEETEKARQQQEKINKQNFINRIKEKGFVLLPAFPANANLTEAAKYNQRHLSLSDGVIIYHSAGKDRMWCLQQQSDVYIEIESLDQNKSRKIEKAVYLDPLHNDRSPTDYLYFNYDVITTDPPELDQFLSKI